MASGGERKAYPLRVDPALLLREALAARGVNLKPPVARKRGRPGKQ